MDVRDWRRLNKGKPRKPEQQVTPAAAPAAADPRVDTLHAELDRLALSVGALVRNASVTDGIARESVGAKQDAAAAVERVTAVLAQAQAAAMRCDAALADTRASRDTADRALGYSTDTRGQLEALKQELPEIRKRTEDAHELLRNAGVLVSNCFVEQGYLHVEFYTIATGDRQTKRTRLPRMGIGADGGGGGSSSTAAASAGGGNVTVRTATTSGNALVTDDILLVNAVAADVTITVLARNKLLKVKRTNATGGNVLVKRVTGLIDKLAQLALDDDLDAVDVVDDGANLWVVS